MIEARHLTKTDMTSALGTRTTKRAPMDKTRKTALVAGSGSSTGVVVGGFLEVIVALAGIGTAVTLYPVVKRQPSPITAEIAAAKA
jgi:hypothetical protein